MIRKKLGKERFPISGIKVGAWTQILETLKENRGIL